MKLFEFKSIRGRLSYWFLILSLIPLFSTLVITYFQRVSVIETRTFDKLTALRDLKVTRLNDWIIELESDISAVSTDNELTDLELVIKTLLENPDISNFMMVGAYRNVINLRKSSRHSERSEESLTGVYK